MKKINLRDIICDLCTYIKEGELIKNGIYYSIGAIIAPLEPELWSYYKGLRGEQSLENHFFHIDKEEKQKKAAAVKPKKVPLNDTALFTEIAQVWIIVQTLGYDYDSIYDISLFVESILDAFLEHRLNRKVPYQERTVKLVFDELEILEGDTAAFYRRHTRLLCFLQFYRDDIHRFFSLLNNLIINKAYQDSFIRNVDTKENIDPTKLLPTELNVEEARDMLQLFAHRNNRSMSLSDHKAYNDPSRYYIYNLEAVIWLFNDYFGFEQKEKDPTIFKGIFSISKIDEYKQYFEDALKSLEDKIAEFPALALLLERASRYLTFIDLQRYFPCIHNSEISHDADIYRSLKVAKIENGAQYSWFEASYLNALSNRCFKYDVEDSRPFSNKRMKLLQTMFLGSLWGLLCTQSYIKSDKNSEQQKWRELLDTLFRSFSPNSGAAEYATGVLNRLIELCCIKTEMFFDTVDFTALNKSSDFTSNETLLHLYYTVTHFLTEKKYCLLAQLDFTAEMQRRILPIPSKNNKKSKRKIARESKSDSEEIKDEKILAANHNTLKRLDCGFSFLVLRQSVVPFGDPWSNECFLERPNFSFRLWFDSVYEDYNPSTQKKYTDEQKYRNLNKSCIENHFFYSADRNMETHFSLHHAVEAVLEKPKRILYALYDIKQYLERIKPQQPEGSLAVPFLQEKLEHIFSTICLVLFPECPSKSWDAVFDSDGIILEDVAIRFDLLKDFGKEFYTAVKEFLKIMFTGQSDWMEELDFELLIYLIYITLHLAKRDAGQTDDTPLIFNCTEDEQKRWQKTADFVQAWRSNRHSGSQLTGLLPHSYSVFHYQLSDNIQSRNIKQWQSLPVSAIIHLYNGNFEKLPQYLRNMHGIIDDAKRLFELKSIETNHSIIRESYKKLITERWNNFARKKLRKTEADLRLFNPNDSSKNTENTTLLDNLRDLLNPNAPEDKFYSFSLNMKGSYQGISTTGKTEEITVAEKPRCVSYSFDIENKDENTRDDWRAFHIYTDVLLKDNDTELELCLFFDEWDEQNKKIYNTFFTVPLAQYTLLPKFLYALYEYWTCYSNSYYEIIEITREYDGYKYKKPKPRKKEIAKVFTETARNIFGTNAKTESLTLTPRSFKEHMEALEEPEQRIGSSYSEITEVSGIRQLILSTGIDAVHIQLAITLNNSLTELEVYFDAKTDPSEKPLFVINSTDYRLLASFFAELKAHQVKDMFTCKRILDEHRETLK